MSDKRVSEMADDEIRALAGSSAEVVTLFADPAVTCQETADALPYQPVATGGCSLCDTEFGLCTERCTPHPCTAMSRFVVERSDGDQSFGWDGKHESCEAHLADVVSGMVNGDDVRAVVTIRWDPEPERPAVVPRAVAGPPIDLGDDPDGDNTP